MMLPERRKPIAGKATGFLKIDVLAGDIDAQEDSFKAAGSRARAANSWPGGAL